MSFETIKVLHINFIKSTFENFINQLDADLKNNENKFIVTANPEIVLSANENSDFQKLINEYADYVTPDGIGIVKAAKTLGTPIPERITGFDTMLELLKIANTKHYKVFLVGAKPEVIKASAEKIKSDYPGIELVGYQDGYFKNDKEVQNTIINAEPDMVFAALGSPKQEFFIKAMIERRKNNAIWMGVGGSFDVFSGMKKRAPKVFQDIHLEWLYRFITEPTRAKRMLAIPKFMLKIQKEKFSK